MNAALDRLQALAEAEKEEQDAKQAERTSNPIKKRKQPDGMNEAEPWPCFTHLQ